MNDFLTRVAWFVTHKIIYLFNISGNVIPVILFAWFKQPGNQIQYSLNAFPYSGQQPDQQQDEQHQKNDKQPWIV